MAAFSIDVNARNFHQVVIEGSKQAPVVIDFWAPWCGPCRALTPILEKLASEYAGRFTLAKINSDENQELAAQFAVRGIPAVKAIVNGAIADEFTGALPESRVRAFIDALMPTPADLLQREASALAAEGRVDEALSKLEAALAHSPRHEAANIDKLALLVEAGRNDEARAWLQGLDPLLAQDNRVAPLKARLAFAKQANEGDRTDLERRIAGNPADLEARLALARVHVHAQDYEAAFAQLLEIVRRDRKFGDDIGRKTMLELFNLLGGGTDIVGKYRKLLAGALY